MGEAEAYIITNLATIGWWVVVFLILFTIFAIIVTVRDWISDIRDRNDMRKYQEKR